MNVQRRKTSIPGFCETWHGLFCMNLELMLGCLCQHAEAFLIIYYGAISNSALELESTLTTVFPVENAFRISGKLVMCQFQLIKRGGFWIGLMDDPCCHFKDWVAWTMVGLWRRGVFLPQAVVFRIVSTLSSSGKTGKHVMRSPAAAAMAKKSFYSTITWVVSRHPSKLSCLYLLCAS